MAFEKSRDELEVELAEQADELRTSCESYDAGKSWEAKRIAASVYKLVMDGSSKSNTRSLLSTLGLKDKAQFYSTTTQLNEDVVNWMRARLCLIYTGNGDNAPRFDPLCKVPEIAREQLRPVNFTDWWSEPIYTTQDGANLLRWELVAILRNQDGGGHVDAQIRNEAYHAFKNLADFYVGPLDDGRWMFSSHPDPGTKPLTSGPRASIRQVGWEVDLTLRELGL